MTTPSNGEEIIFIQNTYLKSKVAEIVPAEDGSIWDNSKLQSESISICTPSSTNACALRGDLITNTNESNNISDPYTLTVHNKDCSIKKFHIYSMGVDGIPFNTTAIFELRHAMPPIGGLVTLIIKADNYKNIGAFAVEPEKTWFGGFIFNDTENITPDAYCRKDWAGACYCWPNEL